MRPATAAWLEAAQRTATRAHRSGAYRPVVLAHFTTFQRYFASQSMPASPYEYEYELARLDQGGVQSLQVGLEEMTGAVTLSTMALRFLNLEQLWHTFDGVMANTRVQIWLTFAGLGETDALALFPGIVDRHSFDRTTLELNLIDASFRLHRSLSVPIGGQYFPGAPQESRNVYIPIILGRAIDAPTVQIAGIAQGTLAYPLAAAATELYLVEIGAPFPLSGTITLGSGEDAEHDVTYTARDLVLRSGITSLRLSGLTRPTAAVHAAETVVSLVSSAFAYLIGYQVRSLQGVRDDGAPVTSDQYTLVTMQADRPVSVLLFPSQRGRVTVDVNGPNVDLDELLSNGGFETGDLTGWSTGSGSAAVGSVTPAPFVGLYRGALTAPNNTTPGTLYQDIPVLPGATYVMRLSYQNVKGVSSLTNAGFETGDLTGWTLSNVWDGTSYAVVRGNSPPGSYQSIFGYRPLYLGPAAEGAYFLQITGQTPSYHLALFQDVPTVAAGEYVLRVFFRFSLFASAPIPGPGLAPGAAPAGAPRAGSSDNSLPIAAFWNLAASYMVGTPVSPGAHATGLFTSAQVLSSLWLLSADIPFTATTTTTRITLIAQGAFHNITPNPISFDEIQLEQVGAFATSHIRVALGTPAESTLIAEEEYPAAYAWTPLERIFKVPDNLDTIRVAVQSTYTGASPLASFFDQISVRLGYSAGGLGGENPVDAIRYMLETFLPEAVYDTANFSLAAQVLMGWKFGAVLTNPGDSRALLQRMAYQCGSLLFHDGLGRFKMTVLNASRIVQAVFDTSNILVDSCTIRFEPIDNLYSDFYVWFAAKTGGSGSTADFQGVVYATPLGTTAVSAPMLVTQCGIARDLYGREHRLDYYAEFIQDVGTAHLFLTWLVSRLTLRATLVTFRTWLDGLPLEIGDLISMTHPLVGTGSEPVVCEVVNQQTDFATMQVELVVRTLELAGWRADFEYVQHLILDAGWFTDWDYTLVPLPADGWSAEFENV